MTRTALLSLLLISALALPAQCQEKVSPQKQTNLTEEEKEILKHRELLENIELLLHLEKIQYLDLFTEVEPDKEKNLIPRKAERNGRKK